MGKGRRVEEPSLVNKLTAPKEMGWAALERLVGLLLAANVPNWLTESARNR